MTIAYAWSPSVRLSSTPVTVTVWATFQLAIVKVTELGATVPSVVSLLVRPMLTLAAGWVVSRIVNVEEPPASVVTRPLVGVTMIPRATAVVTGARTMSIPATRPVVTRSDSARRLDARRRSGWPTGISLPLPGWVTG